MVTNKRQLKINMRSGGFLGAIAGMAGRQALSYLVPKVASWAAGKVMGKKGKKGTSLRLVGGSGMPNKGRRMMGMGNEGTPMKGMRSHQMGYGMNNMGLRMGNGVRPGGSGLRPLGGALRLLGSKGKRYSGNSIMNRIVQAAKKRGKQELKRSVNYAIDNPKKSYKKVKKLFTGSGYKKNKKLNKKYVSEKQNIA